jgi:hypothetical protein
LTPVPDLRQEVERDYLKEPLSARNAAVKAPSGPE